MPRMGTLGGHWRASFPMQRVIAIDSSYRCRDRGGDGGHMERAGSEAGLVDLMRQMVAMQQQTVLLSSSPPAALKALTNIASAPRCAVTEPLAFGAPTPEGPSHAAIGYPSQQPPGARVQLTPFPRGAHAPGDDTPSWHGYAAGESTPLPTGYSSSPATPAGAATPVSLPSTVCRSLSFFEQPRASQQLADGSQGSASGSMRWRWCPLSRK